MQLESFKFQGFGGLNEIQLLKEELAVSPKALEKLISEAQRIEMKFSRFLPESIISEINSSAGIKSIKVDPETASLLNFADTCYRESEGLFDITSGVLRKAWDFKTPRIPSNEELAKIVPLIGRNKVEWDGKELYLPIKEMQIDFGGFGKEYATDRLVSLATELGLTKGIINLGGDVRLVGSAEKNDPLRIGIVHPRKENQILAWLELLNGALATSGDYERYFELNGRRYSHILNVKTGFPVDSFQSVSVLNESCLLAGAVATISMLKGELKGERYLRESRLSFLAVRKDGTLIKSEHKRKFIHEELYL